MTEPEAILERALAAVDGGARDLEGLRVVVSAGGTREPIDPVRFIGNRSSGRQGVAVAMAAADRGADVVLIAAHVDDGPLVEACAHPRVRIVRAGTAAELGEVAAIEADSADIVVMAAAVADYRVAEVSPLKRAKESAPGDGITLDLIENDDILAALVRARRDGQSIVGFAAETPGEARRSSSVAGARPPARARICWRSTRWAGSGASRAARTRWRSSTRAAIWWRRRRGASETSPRCCGTLC